jgi:hypothetical protein
MDKASTSGGVKKSLDNGGNRNRGKSTTTAILTRAAFWDTLSIQCSSI